MRDDLRNRNSVSGLCMNHLRNQVHQLVSEESQSSFLISTMESPEKVKSVCKDELVMRISSRCFSEWGMSWNHDEKDSSSSKNICLVSTISATCILHNFRSHIPSSSLVWSVDWSERWKSIIGNLEVCLSVKQDVLWLEVSMRHTLFLHVRQSWNKLLEVKSCELVGESSSLSDVIEHFALFAEF